MLIHLNDHGVRTLVTASKSVIQGRSRTNNRMHNNQYQVRQYNKFDKGRSYSDHTNTKFQRRPQYHNHQISEFGKHHRGARDPPPNYDNHRREVKQVLIELLGL